MRPFLKRFQAKWLPVRVKQTRQNKKPEPRSDFVGSELALAAVFLTFSAAPTFAVGDCFLDHCADRSFTVAQGSFYDSVRQDAATAGRFDFYVLALSWSPSYCGSGGDNRSPAQCAAGANPGFVLHGLWPQNFYGGYPSDCPGNTFPLYSALAGLDGLYPEQSLARHEWRRHGACSGKPPSAYFADVRKARDSVVIPDDFKAPQAEKTLAPLDVQRAFVDANRRLRPGMLAVTCQSGVLKEVRICMSKDLRSFVACPVVARQACRDQSISVPAWR